MPAELLTAFGIGRGDDGLRDGWICSELAPMAFETAVGIFVTPTYYPNAVHAADSHKALVPRRTGPIRRPASR